MTADSLAGSARQDFLSALRSSDRTAARKAVLRAMDQGLITERTIQEVVVPSLITLGAEWEEGTVALTQVYMGGRIAEVVVEEILPKTDSARACWGRVLIGTLEDRHGMGQRIVASYLETSGAEVIRLGIGVDPATFAETARERRVDVIAVSTLMYRAALSVRRIRELLDGDGLNVPLLVGGAPFNMDRELWRLVGASAMGSSPAEAIIQAKRLVSECRK